MFTIFTDSAKYVSTATVHSSKGIKSFFYSNNDDDFFLHRWNFRLNTICRSVRNGDLFTAQKDYCSQFFAYPTKYVSTVTVDSSNGIMPVFYSNYDDDFFLHRSDFRLNTICRSLRNGDLFTAQKDYCSQFFAYPTKYVSTVTVDSSNGIMPVFYSNNYDDVFLHRWNFRLKTFLEASEMGIYLLVQNTIVHNFLRIPQSSFPLLQSTVQMESSRYSTQTMTTTSCSIVETFV